ncbi:hypothetical protein MUA26_04140 [Staphylococcus sp. IVB6246]|uniref:hypothetical protein n=1 Tax=Staphylococcus sp. IVB6246 TaxID=2989772 RepID=UPI0021D0ED17|nr:hypothetical protein [Staphylococcus sp. IVB6246]UXR70326.1 hypothetical protein MUA26_04140 [Staphylococcus sp. IVB6246]
MKDRKIYYSLYDIERDMKKKKELEQDVFISIIFDVLGDLALQISKFYVMDQEDCDAQEYIRQYSQYEKRMYQEKEAMFHQYIFMTPMYQRHLKHGLKIKYKKDMLKRIIKMVQLFETFLDQQLKFPIRLTITFTKKNLKHCDGYIELPHRLAMYPKIKVSLQDYRCIKKSHGTHAAVLNILEILAHEIGHYHEYINGMWFEDELQREDYANDFGQKILQLFFDDFHDLIFKEK